MYTSISFVFRIILSLFLITSLTLIACQQTDSKGEVSSEMSADTPTTSPSENQATAANTGNESLTGTRPAYVPPQSTQAPLTLGVSNQSVKSGNPVCLDIQVADFNQLLSMQYSVRWDPKLLQFKGLQNFQLGGLGPEDFGAHRVAEGILTSVWIDENLQGVTLADGAGIYQICFQAIGAAGQRTEVSLSDGPTPFEVVNLKEEVVGIKGIAGRVTIN